MRITEKLAIVAEQFSELGISSAMLDAELIVSHVLDCDRYLLRTNDDRDLSSAEIQRIDNIVKRRRAFEPVAYILGSKEFYSLDFIVNSDVLIPRPETELLVDMAVYYAPMNGVVVDIGTGSGAIAIALKHTRSDLTVHATDLSDKALIVARKNAARIAGKNNILFHHGDLFDPLADMRFQVIVTNPPYVNRNMVGELQKDLSFEPEVALFAENGGTEIIDRIITSARKYLADNGVLLVEIGAEMADFVKMKGKKMGFSISILNDYAGLPRVAVMK